MGGFGVYALANAWLFALLAPLVLFYFLKLKRPRMEVPSLVLWRQVLADRRVNSPFQKFKRNILLLLQILLLLLLATAALQPFLRRRPSKALRVPVLIDCSASMAALDAPGGSSRLDAAKKKAGEMIDALLPDQKLCLISFSGGARRRTDFTDNKRVLREALDQIKVEDVRSDIEDAMRMTQALARSVAFKEVILLSDGNFPSRAHFQLSFDLNYQRVPKAGPNFGVTSLNARRWAEGDWDVFALIEGSAEAEGSVSVQVTRDGVPLGTEEALLTAGGEQRIMFRVSGERACELEVRLIPEGADSLASDNVAYLNLPALRPLQIFVSPNLDAYAHALRALEGVLVETEPEAGAYDLVVTDRTEDLNMEAGTRFCVGVVPTEIGAALTVAKEQSVVVDWDRASALLQHVELAELAILDQPRSAEGITESDYENAGYEVIVWGDRGPLLLRNRSGNRLSYFLLFHSDRSTLPYRVGFPVLVSNLVQVALRETGLAEVQGRRTGTLGELVLGPQRHYTVDAPDGTAYRTRSDLNGVLAAVPAPAVGYYTVSEGGSEKARVGAALLTSSETSLAGVEQITFAEELSVAASSKELRTDRPLWMLLSVLAFCLLLGEWWYFQRGAGGGTG